MRIIDRLALYLQAKEVSNYAFEHKCGLANGYLNKQINGKGSIGSEIIRRILQEYIDLSLIWLFYGEGPMIRETGNISDQTQAQEDPPDYKLLQVERIKALKLQVELLQSALADKNKIIRLLEDQINGKGRDQ